MNVLIFGASGMIGQGVLRECLLDAGVSQVRAVVRTPLAVTDPKLRGIVHADLYSYREIEANLSGLDACFFCLGVTSAGLAEPEYTKVTYGIATAAAETLARLNPQMTFIFVSGAGADSTEKGGVMWARVKGKTENAILRMPFKAAYVFRPAMVQPANGERSKTAAYRVLYSLMKPLLPALSRAFPKYVITTEQIGRAMLNVARNGAPKKVLESADIRAMA